MTLDGCHAATASLDASPRFKHPLEDLLWLRPGTWPECARSWAQQRGASRMSKTMRRVKRRERRAPAVGLSPQIFFISEYGLKFSALQPMVKIEFAYAT
jgi:hypothetical protein